MSSEEPQRVTTGTCSARKCGERESTVNRLEVKEKREDCTGRTPESILNREVYKRTTRALAQENGEAELIPCNIGSA